ncbi:MAG: exodeoxyribonuclease VII small subunit [Phycisphaerae bacterium]
MSKTPKNLKFEQAMQRLDAIVEAMEAGEIGIEESISKYEEAMQLAAHCRKILDESEQRIKKIQLDAAGKPTAEPFEPPAGPPDEEQEVE